MLRLTAVTRRVSDSFDTCQLEYLNRRRIDVSMAAAQHRDYEACLEQLGVRVVSLKPDASLPDSVFVEDPAIVVDEVAVITRMGTAARRAEAESLARALSDFRPLRWLTAPATLEGGDVMEAGKTLYAGLSRRTNREGIEQLGALVGPFGYRVVPVEVKRCLHLKTGCSWLGDGRVLANREWVDCGALAGCEIVDVPAEEPWAANVLRVGDTVVVAAAFPRTAELLLRAGYQVRTIDISELAKAEAGLTCMSLIFESAASETSADTGQEACATENRPETL